MIVERGYLDHWKTTALRVQTECEAASEFPIRLWEHCESRLGGELRFINLHKDDPRPVPAELQADRIADPDGKGIVIAGICRWSKNPASLTDALVECRWIKKIRGGWIVLGWRERMAAKVASATNGRRGGRPKKNPQDSETEPDPNPEKPTGYKSKPTGGEWSKGKLRGVKESPPPSRAPARAREADGEAIPLETLISAKKRMCGILRCPEQWEPDAERSLLALLPTITEAEWIAVEWLYAQPAEGDGKRKRPLLKTTPRAITTDWAGAVSTARRFALDCGHEFVSGQKNEAPPADWRDWLARRGYPADTDFATVDESVRREYRREGKAVAA